MTHASAAEKIDFARPLAGVRVLEMSDGKGEMSGRMLADLGADVVLVEPPQGVSTRRQPPLVENVSLYFASHNANKRSVALDLNLPADKTRFLQLVDAADIFIETTRPGTLEQLGLGVPSLHRRNPQLVVVSISDFGQTGAFRDFVATEFVQDAMAAILCRSGLPGSDHPPLLPPGSLAYETASVQAAWVAMLAYWQRLQIGVGDHLDFSMYEGIAQILDPVLGVTGSAAGGKSIMQMAESRGRPNAGHLYPIFACKDGYVRMCILNPRQWQGMSEWLGADHPFTDPAYGNLMKRMQSINEIIALIAKLTATMTRREVVAGGQQRGIPVAELAMPFEVLKDEHFRARGAFASLPIAAGITGTVPSGYLEVDGQRAGIRAAAPAIGAHTDEVLTQWQPRAKSTLAFTTGSQRRPLAGLRVLDLGVIVAGAELGRILADAGAEVIKVENRAFPDGGRQSSTPTLVSFSFAQGHRGKESLGINLRSPKGIELFKQLAAKSDMILSNFKPGTMESLGLGYDVISQINPRIIMADSSALGNTGPLARSMGYGPLVRASSGLSGLWRYPHIDGSYCDALTIAPDHFAARVSAIGILALLARRQQSGAGGTVSVSQAETILTALSTEFLRESLQPGSIKPRGNDDEFTAPNGVFPCAGDDEWCVISVRDDRDWENFCNAIGRNDLRDDQRFATVAGRVALRPEINALVTAWTSQHTPEFVMTTLQAAAVPAGKMFRLSEIDGIEHLRSRNFFRTLQQPGHAEAWPTENAPVLSLNMPDPDIRPAPAQAEHTRQVMSRVLGFDADLIQQLIDAGDLEEAARAEV
ncbi:MAG: CoA transferase [Spongiibacteraceae bacterium]